MFVYLPTTRVNGGVLSITRITYITDIAGSGTLYWFDITADGKVYTSTFSDNESAKSAHKLLIDTINGTVDPITGIRNDGPMPPPPPYQLEIPTESKPLLTDKLLFALLVAVLIAGTYRALFS